MFVGLRIPRLADNAGACMSGETCGSACETTSRYLLRGRRPLSAHGFSGQLQARAPCRQIFVDALARLIKDAGLGLRARLKGWPALLERRECPSNACRWFYWRGPGRMWRYN